MAALWFKGIPKLKLRAGFLWRRRKLKRRNYEQHKIIWRQKDTYPLQWGWGDVVFFCDWCCRIINRKFYFKKILERFKKETDKCSFKTRRLNLPTRSGYNFRHNECHHSKDSKLNKVKILGFKIGGRMNVLLFARNICKCWLYKACVQ